MKLTLLLPALVLGFMISTSSEALAFGGAPGGPFSNGSYFPNDGTFSAVVRGENLSGTVQFSTTAGSGVTGAGSTGVSTIYYDGDSYLGNSQGSYNPQSSTMSVNFQASIQGQGEQEFVVEREDREVNPDGTTVITQTPILNIVYFDSLSLTGFADCKASNSFPNQTFKGSGEAEVQFLIFNNGVTGGSVPLLDAFALPVSVTGVRLSNTAQTFRSADVRPPSVNAFSITTGL
jgi:hypothetical protein